MTSNQITILELFKRTGMVNMKNVPVNLRSSFARMVRAGLIADAQRDCGKGEYALTHTGGDMLVKAGITPEY